MASLRQGRTSRKVSHVGSGFTSWACSSRKTKTPFPRPAYTFYGNGLHKQGPCCCQHFDGALDEVVIYPRVLTADEIVENHCVGSGTSTRQNPHPSPSIQAKTHSGAI